MAETEPEMPVTEAEANATEEEPKLLAGKYENVEELEKAYGELQKKLGQNDAQKEEAQPEAPAQVLEADGLQEFYNEYASNGTLSDESLSKLSQTYNIPTEVVQHHLEGVKALANQTLSQAHDRVGGQEIYDAMTTWATSNEKSKVEVANAAIARGDVEAWHMAIDSIYKSYAETNGIDPSAKNTVYTTLTSPGATGFRDRREMQAAMLKKDAQGNNMYETDPEYRNSVRDRVAASKFVTQ